MFLKFGTLLCLIFTLDYTLQADEYHTLHYFTVVSGTKIGLETALIYGLQISLGIITHKNSVKIGADFYQHIEVYVFQISNEKWDKKPKTEALSNSHEKILAWLLSDKLKGVRPFLVSGSFRLTQTKQNPTTLLQLRSASTFPRKQVDCTIKSPGDTSQVFSETFYLHFSSTKIGSQNNTNPSTSPRVLDILKKPNITYAPDQTLRFKIDWNCHLDKLNPFNSCIFNPIDFSLDTELEHLDRSISFFFSHKTENSAMACKELLKFKTELHAKFFKLNKSSAEDLLKASVVIIEPDDVRKHIKAYEMNKEASSMFKKFYDYISNERIKTIEIHHGELLLAFTPFVLKDDYLSFEEAYELEIIEDAGPKIENWILEICFGVIAVVILFVVLFCYCLKKILCKKVKKKSSSSSKKIKKMEELNQL